MSSFFDIISIYHNNKMDFLHKAIVKLFGGWMPDALYLRLLYRLSTGKSLHLNNPQTYNEKLQWIKLYDHNPLYTRLVDKYAVKEYVASIIGEEYIIPTYGVWDCLNEIDFDILPNQFVLKTTFGGGGNDVIICKEKNIFDKEYAIYHLRKYMNQDLYRASREWPYKNVPKRIIAEKYMEESGKTSLTDYKVMCFNGVAKLIELHNGRYTDGHTQEFYDRDWNKTTISQGGYGKVLEYIAERPPQLEEMLELSETLAKDIPHVRVDWYIVDNHLYFGELTFFDGSGLEPWDKDEDDLLMGSWIKLPIDIENKKDCTKGLGNESIEMFY